MKRKAIPPRKRALLQKEIGSACPFCLIEDVDHFQIHHIDENCENDAMSNLLLVCPLCHSKITKGDLTQAEVIARKHRLLQETNRSRVMRGKIIMFKSKVGNAVVGDHNKVVINVKETKKTKYPEGCVGFDVVKANYIGYLLGRYHEYKEYEVGKVGMNYAIFPSHLKSKFKIGKTRTVYNIPLSRFDELVSYVQDRIDGTKLARVQKAKGQGKHYESLEEYVMRHT